MKIILFVLFMIVNYSAKSQSKALVIYVEPAENNFAFSLSNKLFDAIQESESKLILFVSNGTNPLISKNIFESQLVIDKVSKLKSNNVNVLFDLDSLNNILRTDSILIDVRNAANELRNEIEFFFFFDAMKCRVEKQDQKIAEKFLLSNNLLNKDGLLPNCNAKLYIQSISSKEDTLYFKKIKEEALFKVIEY